jgi:integrase
MQHPCGFIYCRRLDVSAIIRQRRHCEYGQTFGQSGMARPLNRLTALKVQRAKKHGLYADGGSLYLRVADGGSKQWVFRYVVNGRLRDMGIGPVHTLTLAEAREKATEARKLRLEGIDPITHKRARMAALRAADARAMTFQQCAEGFIRDNGAKWSNARHAEQWRNTLAQYVYPVLGSLSVAVIDTPLVLKVIKPLWERMPETASRVRGRIENVLGWATVHHYRTGDNPARWKGHLQHALPMRSKVATVEHHAALPYGSMPGFMGRLRQDASPTSACLQFITLTAARIGEAVDATWNEIDLNNRVWTVPPARIKGRVEHRVPLSKAAVALLKQMAAIRHSDFVFPSPREGRPMGKEAVLQLAKTASGRDDLTVHGLRSTFRDWAAERTNFPREIAEKALAHIVGDETERAYQRGDLLEKRRKLMEAWAEFCGKPQSARR